MQHLFTNAFKHSWRIYFKFLGRICFQILRDGIARSKARWILNFDIVVNRITPPNNSFPLYSNVRPSTPLDYVFEDRHLPVFKFVWQIWPSIRIWLNEFHTSRWRAQGWHLADSSAVYYNLSMIRLANIYWNLSNVGICTKSLTSHLLFHSHLLPPGKGACSAPRPALSVLSLVEPDARYCLIRLSHAPTPFIRPREGVSIVPSEKSMCVFSWESRPAGEPEPCGWKRVPQFLGAGARRTPPPRPAGSPRVRGRARAHPSEPRSGQRGSRGQRLGCWGTRGGVRTAATAAATAAAAAAAWEKHVCNSS